MQCTKCGCNTRVTQVAKEDHVIARRRKCQSCGFSFTTQEIESAAAVTTLTRAQREANQRRDQIKRRNKARRRFEEHFKEAMQNEL